MLIKEKKIKEAHNPEVAGSNPAPATMKTRLFDGFFVYRHLYIYDMLGREVKTLVNQTQDAGYRSIIWDATNDNGKPVSAGIYLYQIQAGGNMQTKKMVLLK